MQTHVINVCLYKIVICVGTIRVFLASNIYINHVRLHRIEIFTVFYLIYYKYNYFIVH
ncbi:hypothetical protein [Neodiprion abietis nucleopolyhedrovirus]|uniref:Uncharacterized protein n=1 Tax=Neodiprion abietis nucleopolyhedrovirus TaxID=204507 RepID=Q0ZP69_9CBAC|nr:hypothetical protein [Neodiprion abietis nucleopolyhedrovirus]ABC74885.1 unknown [Neodiprion abietis nucleopolyhedrovirus]